MIEVQAGALRPEQAKAILDIVLGPCDTAESITRAAETVGAARTET